MNYTGNCDVCGIQNKAKLPDDFFSMEETKAFVDGVFSGVINPEHLDIRLYEKMSKQMANSIFKGFGSSLDSLRNGTEEYMLLQDLIESGYFFNAAKQYQLVRQLNDFIDADFATKQEYYDKANSLFNLFNVEYYEIELDSAEHQAASAAKWIDFVKWNGEA